MTPVGSILHTFKLLLPAVIPSWRFFDVIAPSPRIEFCLLETAIDAPVQWQEFRPRPAHVPVRQMLKRLLWNPRWNESLFLVSCAERLMAQPTEHSAREIRTRLTADLVRRPDEIGTTPYMQYRLVFLDRQGSEIHKHTTFTSPVHKILEASRP